MKAKKGTGFGDFFWNIVFDDASGNNLARWYGGSSIARGRVGGGTPTADITLSGPDNWDDLYIKIDTGANTSEFFFNGVSFGEISHGSTPGDSIGSVRIERLDRSSAVNDAIHFDSLTIGAVDLTPPRLGFSRSENTLLLSWAATGAGAKLESASDLIKPISWTPVTNGIYFTNGSNTYATSTSNTNCFFRLHGS